MVNNTNKIKLVLCWHMHQPEYRDLKSGEFKLPWTYLHVIKDYVDMAAHVEATPQAKAVINFAPILLEQIDDYVQQINLYHTDGLPLRDPLLNALIASSPPSDKNLTWQLIKDCLRANRERQINRYPAFKNLAEITGWLEQNFYALDYINPQFLQDILVWYHLVWIAESVKLSDKRIQALIAKATNYTLDDRIQLFRIIGELLSNIVNRYKALAQTGQIELSVTPYAHPIMPLLLDLNTTQEAMPDAPMPILQNYPHGKERVIWHLEKGMQTFEHYFGIKAKGCWPSEGSISTETLHVLSEFGFKWTASGGAVLHNSLKPNASTNTHHPYQLINTDIACFFRDDSLSDLIGFEYSKWHAEDAVTDFIKHLENIASHEPGDKVVSIIMDGENAWEYFPNNGYDFLQSFYKRLATHPSIQLTTFSECLNNNSVIYPLNHLTAGSWVYGTFSTWIGSLDKNRGWDMLGEVKCAFDKAILAKRLTTEQRLVAESQLAVCEGSDWFWWFGDYNPGEAVSSFEKQFRLNLSNLYLILGEEPPAYLAESFTQGHGDPLMGGAMRPGVEH